MNDYRITNVIGVESGTITAIDEQDAKRIYRLDHKGPDARIEKVELLRENVPATKQQERDTLEAIKKMVVSLGPQSYLATAFDGCFQDAEDNIEDDAAYSMKARYESSEEKLAVAQKEIEDLKTHKRLMQETIDRLQRENEALEQRIIAPGDLLEISKLLAEKVLDIGGQVSNAAERIVDAAEEPGSPAFLSAVEDHREAKAELSRYTALLSKINTLRSTVENG